MGPCPSDGSGGPGVAGTCLGDPAQSIPRVCALDKGYDFAEVRRSLDDFGFTAHMGGGTHSQLAEPFPARLVRWDESPDNYIAFLSPVTSSPSEPPGY